MLTEKFRHFMTGHFSHVRNHSTGHRRVNFVAHLLKNRSIGRFGVILKGNRIFVRKVFRISITLAKRPGLLLIALVVES